MKLREERWAATEMGCPECAGVLSVRQAGRHRHREFRCHVGHRFSARSLLQSKEAQLERLLWSALSVMDHLGSLCEACDGDPRPVRTGPSPFRRRLRELQRQKNTIRALIEDTAVCDLGGV